MAPIYRQSRDRIAPRASPRPPIRLPVSPRPTVWPSPPASSCPPRATPGPARRKVEGAAPAW